LPLLKVVASEDEDSEVETNTLAAIFMKSTKAIPKSRSRIHHIHAQKFVYMDTDFLVN
jgi:hypothetical protein